MYLCSGIMNRKVLFIILALVAVSLLVIFGVHGCQRRADQMRAVLDSALEQNRNYIPFTSDSALLEVVGYYDRYGSPNDRLRAHYALGCVYRDLHDAPIALLTWERGIAAADTTAADCDFATLFRVYGQMADIYFRQYMPKKQLEAQYLFCKYALQAGDTLLYIGGLLRRNSALLALGDTAAVLQNIDYVRQLYLERGLKAEAAQVYPSAIQIALDNQQLERAGALMRVYEQESGLFDEQGGIAPSREIYYYFKGMYYIGINRLDSAEHWFRRALRVKGLELKAFHGLMSLYKYQGNIDSTFKYSNLYDKALVDFMGQTKTTAISQTEGMYDYSIQQQMAQEQKDKAHFTRMVLFVVIVLIGIGILLTYFWYRRKKKENEIRQNRLLENYSRAMQELEATRKEVIILQQSASEQRELQDLVKSKNEKINVLTSLIKDLKKQINSLSFDTNEDLIDIVQHFHEMAHPQISSTQGPDQSRVIHARSAKRSEWNKLSKAMKLNHPHFYIYTSVEHHLAPQEYQVCMLSYLNFEIVEMATLLGTSKQSVTNARASVAKKLFGQEKASILNECLKKL